MFRCALFLLWVHILLISFTTIDSNDWILDLDKCSGYQCGLHADICRRSFMPVHMLKAAGSWSVIGGIWLSWLFSCPNEGEAILDHQELMGWKLGREGVLQNLQGPQYLWSGLHGLDRCCCADHLTVGHEWILAMFIALNVCIYKGWHSRLQLVVLKFSQKHSTDMSLGLLRRLKCYNFMFLVQVLLSLFLLKFSYIFALC